MKEDSPILENKLKDLNFPKEGIVGGLIRGDDAMIPRGDFKFKVGDRVLIVTKKEGMKAIEQMFR